jgi:nicotinamidase-related amidase
MNAARWGLLVLGLGFVAVPVFLLPAADEKADKGELKLKMRSRSKDKPAEAVEKAVTWKASNTALVICDVWDDHWCKSAAARVGELTPAIEEVAQTLRKKGVLIIHAPSTCVDFYKDSEARKLAKEAPFSKPPVPLAKAERWGTAWNWPDGKREGVLPIDDSDMGCDCAKKCEIRSPWKRQAAGIKILPGDAISDNGQEVWNLLTAKKIDNVLICGVHLNMCVLGRPFAIRQLVKLGKNVALIRDLTDTMYNPERPPGVTHFAGTRLVVEHVEKYWCPTCLSTDVTGKEAFRFAGEKK